MRFVFSREVLKDIPKNNPQIIAVCKKSLGISIRIFINRILSLKKMLVTAGGG
jgi:hypothetical protein